MDFTSLAPVILPALTGGILGSAVNTAVTLAVQFIPGVRVWFAGLSSDTKRAFFGLLTVAVGIGAFFYSLVDPATQVIVGLVIPPFSIIGGLIAIGGALASLPLGESILFALPETADVIEAKAVRPEELEPEPVPVSVEDLR